jgi:hypothetical protein
VYRSVALGMPPLTGGLPTPRRLRHKLMRQLRRRFLVLVLSLVPGGLNAQEAYKVEELKQGPPASISPEISAALNPAGYRIVDGQGQPFAEIWLRKAIPVSVKPAGPKGVIQFPFLEESELFGLIRLAGEVHDYRDQAIPKGTYTLRYGLQPVNGDHLGVSPFRDYALLLPVSKDKSLANLPRKQLETQSAESAGSSHPAVLFLLTVPQSPAPATPALIHDQEKNTWRVVLPLSLAVKGDTKPLSFPVSIIVVGISEAA